MKHSIFVPATAKTLAALRIILGATAWCYVVARTPDILAHARLPAWQFAPVGVVSVLDEPLAPWIVTATLVAAIVSGIAFVAGWRYRATGPLFAALLLWTITYRNAWGMVFHTENLMVLHVAVLGVARAADAWSLDARRADAAPDTPRFRYGAPVALLTVVTLVTYFIAGYSKLANAGLAWVTEDHLRLHIAFDNVRKAELGDPYSLLGTTMVRYPGVFGPLAGFSLAVEVLAPLVVFHRGLARLWCLAAWSFHVGVFAMMWIVFFYPMLGLSYASLFPVERLVGWAERRWQAWRSST
jgi:hypothetical protein